MGDFIEEAVAVYRIERLISDTFADIRRRQKISSMFGFFQDIAALHAANLGAGVDWLHENKNVAWILMRVRVEIDKYPRLAETVTVETWPQEPKGLYERDYRILSAGGDVLVRAASTWVIMDLAKRDIIREKFMDYKGIEICKERALGRSVGRLKPMDGAEAVYEKAIRYSDLDYNTHVNNAKYVDYTMDVFPYDEHRDRDIKALEMHYVNEAKPGDIIVFRKKETEENGKKYYLEGVGKDSGLVIFNAVCEFE